VFRTVPLSIIRSYSLYTQQWYKSYRIVDSFRAAAAAGSGWNILILLLHVSGHWKNISIDFHQEGFPVTVQNGVLACINVLSTEAVTSLILLSNYQQSFFSSAVLFNRSLLLQRYRQMPRESPSRLFGINALYTIIQRLIWREFLRMSLD
jgi:hypothetical protein